MQKSFLTLVVLTLSSVFAGAAPLNPDLVAKLKSWGDNHSSQYGTILNIPVGSKTDAIKKDEVLIRDIITKMDPDFFKKYQVTIGLYPSSKVTVFSEVVGMKSYSDIMKQIYHFDITKPVYHIGFTIADFREFTSVDQLAFLVGREMVHITEGHLDNLEEQKLEKAVSQQQYSAIADHSACNSAQSVKSADSGPC